MHSPDLPKSRKRRMVKLVPCGNALSVLSFDGRHRACLRMARSVVVPAADKALVTGRGLHLPHRLCSVRVAVSVGGDNNLPTADRCPCCRCRMRWVCWLTANLAKLACAGALALAVVSSWLRCRAAICFLTKTLPVLRVRELVAATT